MAYTKELISEIKELYPENTEIHKLAESGSAFLGRYLDDISPDCISFNTILTATSLDELRKIAMLGKRKIELYKKWCEEDPRKQ